jgi:hypothetical protein
MKKIINSLMVSILALTLCLLPESFGDIDNGIYGEYEEYEENIDTDTIVIVAYEAKDPGG